MSGKMSKFYVLALFLLQWDMISRITKRIMAKCQFHERLWGQSCICSKEKDPQSATHFLAFATSDDFWDDFHTNSNDKVTAEKHLGAS